MFRFVLFLVALLCLSLIAESANAFGGRRTVVVNNVGGGGGFNQTSVRFGPFGGVRSVQSFNNGFGVQSFGGFNSFNSFQSFGGGCGGFGSRAIIIR